MLITQVTDTNSLRPAPAVYNLITVPRQKNLLTTSKKKKTFKPHIEDHSVTDWVRHDSIVGCDTPLHPITVHELSRLLRVAPRNKAPGPDHVTYEVIRHLPPHAVHHLVNIYNNALRLQIFPSVWKHAVVITLPNPGKPAMFPQNRKPISILDTAVQIYESHFI